MQILNQTQWKINFSTQQFREMILIFDIVKYVCTWLSMKVSQQKLAFLKKTVF